MRVGPLGSLNTGRFPSGDAARSHLCSENRIGPEDNDAGCSSEAAASQACEAGLVKGESGTVSDRAGPDVQRQRSVPTEQGPDDGGLSPAQNGRSVPRRVDRDDRRGLPPARAATARARLQWDRADRYSSRRIRGADARISEPYRVEASPDAPRDCDGGRMRAPARGCRRDPRTHRPQAATAEETQ